MIQAKAEVTCREHGPFEVPMEDVVVLTGWPGVEVPCPMQHVAHVKILNPETRIWLLNLGAHLAELEPS